MLQVPFSFIPLNIVGIVGQPAHANNLANAYIGRLHEMNKYNTYSKYLVDYVKLSSNLSHTQILDDWVYQCY